MRDIRAPLLATLFCFINHNSLRIHSTALSLCRFGMFQYRQSPGSIRIRALLGDVIVFIRNVEGATDPLDGRVESPAKALLLVPLNRAGESGERESSEGEDAHGDDAPVEFYETEC